MDRGGWRVSSVVPGAFSCCSTRFFECLRRPSFAFVAFNPLERGGVTCLREVIIVEDRAVREIFLYCVERLVVMMMLQRFF